MTIVTTPRAFLQAADSITAGDRPAVPGAVFLVTPAGFALNAECATDNRYMDLGQSVDSERAAAQHRNLVKSIRDAGVPVKLFQGDPETPDGLFPNNVFATASGGRFIVGSMRHPARRQEAARRDIRHFFVTESGYQLIDLSTQRHPAELTGVLVIDRGRGIGFCGLSERVDEAGCRAMHQAFGLRLTYRFELTPDEYHTNVLMSVLAGRAVIVSSEGFLDSKVPETVSTLYPERALLIDEREKAGFAANCIALTDSDLFMSETAVAALRPSSLTTLESWGFTIHSVALDEIEKAGGSLRCLIAEIF